MRATLFSLLIFLSTSQVAMTISTRPLPFKLAPRSGHAHFLHESSSTMPKTGRRHRAGPLRLSRRAASTGLLLDQLQGLCGNMQSNQEDISGVRQQVAKDPSSGHKYSNALSNKLAAMRKASGGATPIISQLNTALAPFGADDGKEYYDQSSGLETLLKTFVDSNKYMLTDIDYIIYKVPGLGPVLGPIVYDIKCVVEDLLNGIENTTDGLLNGDGLAGLQSLLSGFDFLGGLGLNLAR